MKFVPVERHAEKGRPKLGAQKVVVGYQIQATFTSCLEKIRLEKQSLGRFIKRKWLIARCSTTTLCSSNTKKQSCVESGFKFIKDNAFELDSFYLKNTSKDRRADDDHDALSHGL